MKQKILLLVGILISEFVLQASAQTTLSGDHIITGNLNVGTTGAVGGVEVTGALGNAAAPGLKVDGDGGVLFNGTYGLGQIPATGAGTRFMWYPKKAALRAGRATATEWNDSNVGNLSSGFGHSPLASGVGAVAFSSISSGDYSFSASSGVASGNSSIAMSGGAASGWGSFALGEYSEAGGDFSIAIGDGLAYGDTSVAIGDLATAEGTYSVAFGNLAIALGYGAFSIGEYTMADGLYALAFGLNNEANASLAFAIGENLKAESPYSFVIGRHNMPLGSESRTDWVGADSLFVIGNGTGVFGDPVNIRNRNALVVKKNGDVVIPKRQGDILMGEFGIPE